MRKHRHILLSSPKGNAQERTLGVREASTERVGWLRLVSIQLLSGSWEGLNVFNMKVVFHIKEDNI